MISNFQMRYIKTGVFEKQLSNIIKSALRTESDYGDFFVIEKEDVKRQVDEAEVFFHAIEAYIKSQNL